MEAATYVPEPASGLQPALGEKLVEGLLGHRPRHPEIRGEAARARQSFAGGQGARGDQVPDLTGQLDAQRRLPAPVEPDG